MQPTSDFHVLARRPSLSRFALLPLTLPLSLGGLLAPGVAGCRGPGGGGPAVVAEAEPVALRAATGVTISEVAWKERLEVPYVYREHVGDYRELGDAMRALLERALLAQIDASGPPFVLHFDDPGRVPAERLRARVCLPVRAGAAGAPGLRADILPRALVAYAEVRGPYPELPRAYPALFTFVRDHGWSPAGPLRTVYLVDPGSVASWSELASEIQLPWTR